MPQAMERSLATPMTRPRLPLISPCVDIACSNAGFGPPAKGKPPKRQAFRGFRVDLPEPCRALARCRLRRPAMNVADERTRSVWVDAPSPKAPPLDRNLSADVVVVGSGIAGLSVAYELAARGRSVAVLDRGQIGSGMTARTTGHLVSALDDFYSELIKMRDEKIARLLHESLAASVDRAEAIQAKEGIDCDFARLDGYLFRAPECPESELQDDLEACRKVSVPVSSEHSLPFAVHGDVLALRF